jgi:hypothetical protein
MPMACTVASSDIAGTSQHRVQLHTYFLVWIDHMDRRDEEEDWQAAVWLTSTPIYRCRERARPRRTPHLRYHMNQSLTPGLLQPIVLTSGKPAGQSFCRVENSLANRCLTSGSLSSHVQGLNRDHGMTPPCQVNSGRLRASGGRSARARSGFPQARLRPGRQRLTVKDQIGIPGLGLGFVLIPIPTTLHSSLRDPSPFSSRCRNWLSFGSVCSCSCERCSTLNDHNILPRLNRS